MDINTGSLVNQGLIGMQRSQSEMLTAARQIASAATAPEPVDVVQPLVNLKQQAVLFDSSARVIEAADNNLGRLLDTKA